MMKHYVYCILLKGEHRPCYIGATSNPVKREQKHRHYYCQEGASFVVLEILDTVAEARKLESELIRWYLQRGVKLDNKVSSSHYHGPRKHEPKPWRFAPPEPPHKPLYDSPELSAFAAAYLAKANII